MTDQKPEDMTDPEWVRHRRDRFTGTDGQPLSDTGKEVLGDLAERAEQGDAAALQTIANARRTACAPERLTAAKRERATTVA